MSQEHFYEVTLDWNNDRKGTLHSAVLPTTIEVATPPEFPKGMEGIWSPEHLLVAAVNSCLMTTFLAIAENSKLEFTQFSSRAVGKLETVDNKMMITEIILTPTVTITNEEQRDRANRVLQKSENNCLISNSVKSAIVLQPNVVVAVTDLV